VNDPYLQLNGTLKNRFGIVSQDLLSRVEANFTAVRLSLLGQEGSRGPFNFARLLATHQYIFQDVYSWAGQLRTTELYKAARVHGPLHQFVSVKELAHEAERIFGDLAKHNELKGLDRKPFCYQAAQLLCNLNQLHPFREGNGRTQRAFLQALAKDAGYELSFDVVSRERMMKASIEGSEGDVAMMERMFLEVTDASRVAGLREAIRFFEAKGYPWNDRYLATTESGRSYAGQVVGRVNAHFMMHDGEQIFVAQLSDVLSVPASGESVAFMARG
jgi:cell filamentation protein